MDQRICRNCWQSLFVFITASWSLAAEPVAPRQLDLAPLNVPGLIQLPIGVTRQGTPIPAVITADEIDPRSKKGRVLLVVGLDGSRPVVDTVVGVMHRFYSDDAYAKLRRYMSVSAVVCTNPDGYRLGTGSRNASQGDVETAFPPQAPWYLSPTTPETQYLWRWIETLGPDVVLEVTEGQASQIVSTQPYPKGTLSWALNQKNPSNAAEPNPTMAFVFTVRAEDKTPFHKIGDDLMKSLADQPADEQPHLSNRRNQLRELAERTPRQVCDQLALVYGRQVKKLTYTITVQLQSRIQLGVLSGDRSHVDDASKILAPYFSGAVAALDDKSSGSELAAHQVFTALHDATDDEATKAACVRLVKAAADRAFLPDGNPREAMPTHAEMSDAVYMACPLLAQAGRLTGEAKYYEMSLRHLRFMQQLDRRSDGLYRHSPLDEAAWGRGNGFPALGVALALDNWPADQPGRAELLASLKAHLDALVKHQDPTGCWRQVIDHPESYRELTCTCMITTAMARGIRRGWLDRERYLPVVERAWLAIKQRVDADGKLVDVCTGTGKQKSLRDYLDREALRGRDDRGGSMALLVAVEMLALEQASR